MIRKHAAAIALLAVLAVIAAGVMLREREAAEEALRRSREYEENLRLVVDAMLSGAVEAEECCNLTVQVWNNAIWQQEDDATNPYTKPEGRFVTDFNDALYNLYADPAFCAKLDDITENQRTVEAIVRRLKNHRRNMNPPMPPWRSVTKLIGPLRTWRSIPRAA